MPLIELNDVRRVYDLGEVEVHALRTVTLNIELGEYVALIGPSGQWQIDIDEYTRLLGPSDAWQLPA